MLAFMAIISIDGSRYTWLLLKIKAIVELALLFTLFGFSSSQLGFHEVSLRPCKARMRDHLPP